MHGRPCLHVRGHEPLQGLLARVFAGFVAIWPFSWSRALTTSCLLTVPGPACNFCDSCLLRSLPSSTWISSTSTDPTNSPPGLLEPDHRRWPRSRADFPEMPS